MRTACLAAFAAAVSFTPTARVAVGSPVSELAAGDVAVVDPVSDPASPRYPLALSSPDRGIGEIPIEVLLALEAGRQRPAVASPDRSIDIDARGEVAASLDESGSISASVAGIVEYVGGMRWHDDVGTASAPRASLIIVTIDPTAVILDLDGDAATDREPRLAMITERVINRLAASGTATVDEHSTIRLILDGSSLAGLPEVGRGSHAWAYGRWVASETAPGSASHPSFERGPYDDGIGRRSDGWPDALRQTVDPNALGGFRWHPSTLGPPRREIRHPRPPIYPGP